MTKDLNWKISTKNLVTFKRWDGEVHEKKNFLFEGGRGGGRGRG